MLYVTYPVDPFECDIEFVHIVCGSEVIKMCANDFTKRALISRSVETSLFSSITTCSALSENAPGKLFNPIIAVLSSTCILSGNI